MLHDRILFLKSSWLPSFPKAPSGSRNDVVQVEEYGANIEDQVKDTKNLIF